MLFKRMLRAAMLDASLYRELRTDPIAGVQAVVVVLLASIATVIGAAALETLSDGDVGGGIAQAVFLMPGLWLIQATSALMFGRLSYDRGAAKPSVSQVAIALGYSASPGVLFVFLLLPLVGPPLSGLVVLYMVVTMVVAVKSTLGVAAFRAFLAVAPGLVLRVAVGAGLDILGSAA